MNVSGEAREVGRRTFATVVVPLLQLAVAQISSFGVLGETWVTSSIVVPWLSFVCKFVGGGLEVVQEHSAFLIYGVESTWTGIGYPDILIRILGEVRDVCIHIEMKHFGKQLTQLSLCQALYGGRGLTRAARGGKWDASMGDSSDGMCVDTVLFNMFDAVFLRCMTEANTEVLTIADGISPADMLVALIMGHQRALPGANDDGAGDVPGASNDSEEKGGRGPSGDRSDDHFARSPAKRRQPRRGGGNQQHQNSSSSGGGGGGGVNGSNMQSAAAAIMPNACPPGLGKGPSLPVFDSDAGFVDEARAAEFASMLDAEDVDENYHMPAKPAASTGPRPVFMDVNRKPKRQGVDDGWYAPPPGF